MSETYWQDRRERFNFRIQNSNAQDIFKLQGVKYMLKRLYPFNITKNYL